jgi:hypothetical protein
MRYKLIENYTGSGEDGILDSDVSYPNFNTNGCLEKLFISYDMASGADKPFVLIRESVGSSYSTSMNMPHLELVTDSFLANEGKFAISYDIKGMTHGINIKVRVVFPSGSSVENLNVELYDK